MRYSNRKKEKEVSEDREMNTLQQFLVKMKASWSSINDLLLFVISSISTIPAQRFQHHSFYICLNDVSEFGEHFPLFLGRFLFFFSFSFSVDYITKLKQLKIHKLFFI